jgi:molybdopterin molybdotransferase
MISPEAAWQCLLPHLAPLAGEAVARRAAVGRVLAESCRATVDVPAADVSAMDGFALGAGNGVDLPPDAWPVTGIVAAGDPPGASLSAGSAMRIMTGAALPHGADRVIPVEQTEVSRDPQGRERVRLLAAASAGDHVRRRGEVVRAGQPLLAAGTLLTPGALSVLATHGIAEVPVHRAPRVAVLVTGDEVVPPERQPAPGQLRDSHTDFLLAAGSGLGLSFQPLGIAPDHLATLRERVRQGLEFDVLLLTGGVSMGEFDFVEQVLAELGCTMLFDGVSIQPGKPVVAARHAGGLVFGLPGNPASAMVVFWLLVRPALRRLLGIHDGFWHGALRATLAAPLPGAKGRDRFLPARLEVAEGEIQVTPLPPVGSHDLQAYGAGTGLVRVPAGAPPAPAGAACEILLLTGSAWDGAATKAE